MAQASAISTQHHPRRLIAFASALLLATFTGCKDERPAAQTPVPVRVQRIVVEATTEMRAYTGVVRARYETDLGFRVAGKIVDRLVNVGDRVVTDQILARLDSTDYRLAVESSEAELAAARSSLAQAAAEEDRARKLLAEQWIAPASYEQKKATADEARGRVERALRALDTARNQLSYTNLRADADGVITALVVEVGQVVAIGQLVARLAQMKEREVVVSIPESRLEDARAAEATVDLWADGARQYGSTLREFSPQADSVTRTYQARFTIVGADDAVALGMTATVRLRRNGQRRAVRVPLGAIYEDGRGPAVWVVTADRAHVRRAPVEVIEFGQNDVLMTSGLDAGERIVSLGAQFLDEKRPVRIVEERAAAN